MGSGKEDEHILENNDIIHLFLQPESMRLKDLLPFILSFHFG